MQRSFKDATGDVNSDCKFAGFKVFTLYFAKCGLEIMTRAGTAVGALMNALALMAIFSKIIRLSQGLGGGYL